MTPAETFHPGEYILDELEARGIPPRMLAKMAGITQEQVLGLMAQTISVDDKIAFGLSRAFGTSAEVWMKLQRAYDAHIDGSAAE